MYALAGVHSPERLNDNEGYSAMFEATGSIVLACANSTNENDFCSRLEVNAPADPSVSNTHAYVALITSIGAAITGARTAKDSSSNDPVINRTA